MSLGTYYGPRLTGDAADPVDALMSFTGGDILRLPGAAAGGEYDPITSGAVSRAQLRRLTGGRLVSRSHGLPADVLAAAALERGCAAGESVDGFVAWYVQQGLTGLDHRAARREGSPCADADDPDRVADYDAWQALTADGPTDTEYLASLVALLEVADTVPPAAQVHRAPITSSVRPSWVTDWQARLEYGPKRDWFAAYAAHRLDGAPCPDMSVSWAEKVARQWANRARHNGGR